MDEIRVTGSLPNLDLEIVRRDGGDGRETVSVTVTATPSLGHAALTLLGNPALFMHALTGPGTAGLPLAADPLGLWMRMAESAWRPWIAMAMAINPLMRDFDPRHRG